MNDFENKRKMNNPKREVIIFKKGNFFVDRVKNVNLIFH